jgi:cytochrome c
MRRLAVILALACMPFAANAAEADADAAQALLKKSNCMKCHAIEKKKDGTPYREVAKKYKGKADAEEKLFKHITTGPMVKNGDKEEEHAKIKSTDDAEIRNVIRWILSL